MRSFSNAVLACRVPLGTVTMVAKIASTTAKPDGLLVVPAADTVRFLHCCPSVGSGVGTRR